MRALSAQLRAMPGRKPRMFGRVLSGLVDLLAPPRCAACAGLLAARSPGFCGACEPLLEPASASYQTDEVRAAYVYGGPLAEAIAALKYRGALGNAPALAALVEARARELTGLVDVVTAVPLHPRRLRSRGYNQAALLARPVAKLLDVPFRPGLSRRVRAPHAQVGAARQVRKAQMDGAFAAAPTVRGKRILVVDDVRTSGATLEELSRTLLAAGAARVVSLVVAQAPLPGTD